MKQIANLTTFFIEAENPEQVILLLHGYGANGQDLMPIANMLELHKKTTFIFPQGPVVIPFAPGYEGYAWFPIDQLALEQAMATGQFRDYRNIRPNGLDEAQSKLSNFIHEIQRMYPNTEIILGGFSQGAMMSADYIFHGKNLIRKLLFLSGTLLSKDTWKKGMQEFTGQLSVFQSHGKFDPLLSYEYALEFKQMLEEAKIPVQFCSFPGQHEIPLEVIQQLSDFLNNE
ncbi:MAG: esterase [Candidatus Hydrogenedentota bacterium]|nr:MAG: esterase [Candidatus Hydrogenedentota bacterium]